MLSMYPQLLPKSIFKAVFKNFLVVFILGQHVTWPRLASDSSYMSKKKF